MNASSDISIFSTQALFLALNCSVADPYHFDADPDPDSDTDPR